MRRRELRRKTATIEGTETDGRFQPPHAPVPWRVWQTHAPSNFKVVIAQTAWQAFERAHFAQLAFSDVRSSQGIVFDTREL